METHFDRIYRKKDSAAFIGVSGTTLWRMEKAGVLTPIQITPGVQGYRASTLRAFLDSRPTAVHDRSKVEAALASPRHGRAGRAPQAVEA